MKWKDVISEDVSPQYASRVRDAAHAKMTSPRRQLLNALIGSLSLGAAAIAGFALIQESQNESVDMNLVEEDFYEDIEMLAELELLEDWEDLEVWDEHEDS